LGGPRSTRYRAFWTEHVDRLEAQLEKWTNETMSQGGPPAWVTYSPLAVLLFSVLYALVLPYAALWRIGRRTD
jgi:hypothetical protein